MELAPSTSSRHSAALVWWRLLLHRIDQVRVKLPATLKGVVQLEIEGSERAMFLRLDLDGAKTSGREGFAPRADCWISTTTGELEALLAGREPIAGALRASGEVALFTTLLEHLTNNPQASNWLKLRASK